MTCVGLLALAIGRERQGASAESPPAKLAAKGKDINILRGLAYLYRCVGTPTGQMEDPIALPFGDYYYLWSLERVAMLYNLPTLADKEWYRWGAEILVTNQDSNGSFVGGTQWWKEPLALNTAFALLFLKHSHPMKDLTPRLPFKPEALNESVARLVPKGKVPDRSTASPGQRRDLDRSTTSPGKIPNPGR